jgi:ribosomal small subunit protein bTHX
MGKGDQRSRRGKIHRGTFGRRRPKPKLHKAATAPEAPAETATSRERLKEAKVVKKHASE